MPILSAFHVLIQINRVYYWGGFFFFSLSLFRSSTCILNLYGVFIQTLIPLNQAPNQKRPAAPESRQRSLILRPTAAVRRAQRSAQREPVRAHQVPEADVPPQHPRRGPIPDRLRLEHEQGPGDDEAGSADDLGRPVDPVEQALGHDVVDPRQGGQSGDPEYRGAEELR